jgi:hypothetical protein
MMAFCSGEHLQRKNQQSQDKKGNNNEAYSLRVSQSRVFCFAAEQDKT